MKFSLLLLLLITPGVLFAETLERLDRGVVAVPRGDGTALVSWRLLATDKEDAAFDVERVVQGKEPTKLNDQPLAGATCIVDREVPETGCTYIVKFAGRDDPSPGKFALPAKAKPYLAIPLQTLAGHTPNDASVGDLDGDGQYEVVLKQEMRPRDNSQRGETGETKLEAYRLDGKMLWRINLGPNIREGAHYTQFIVYDLDGDGRAEIACKTSDGTVDGTGVVIGDAKANHRNENGYVLKGPEFLTVFEGLTGKAIHTIDYDPPRGDVRAWGDDYGNRVDRFNAAVAYLDGQRPSLIMCRGYYTRTVIVAWDWSGKELKQRWKFDTNARGNRDYAGQGNHNISVGDVDGDGRDEIVYGACVIDDDGRGLYSTKLDHGDALHLSDIDPSRLGLEIFCVHEKAKHVHGVELRDGKTGRILWSKPSPDVARGAAMDIDPRHHGYEMWAAGAGLRGLWNAKGETIGQRKPRSCNFGVWWDGDRVRELLDRTTISKWNWERGDESVLLSVRECASNNGTKATPALCGDILGDWREEVLWRSADNRELRIYSTPIETNIRLRTLMHDRQYRLSVCWQNVGYNQPTQPGFYLGEGKK